MKLFNILRMEWSILKTKKLFLVGWLVVSVVFSIAFMLSPIMRTVEGGEINWLRFPVGMLIFIIGTFVVYRGSLFISIHSNQEKWIRVNGRILALICFAMIVAVDTFYLLVYYPGTGMYDTLYIVSSTGAGVMKQHPWFYVLLVRAVVKCVGFLGGGYEAALVALSFIQISLLAGVCTYCLVWLWRKHINFILWILIAVCYTFCPYFNLCSINIFKDIPFSIILILWIPILYDAWESKGETLLKKGIIIRVGILLVMALLRNNGIYTAVLILFSIFLFLPHKWKYMKWFFAEVGVLILVVMGGQMLESRLGVEHLFKETVGVPLQQIAAVVCDNGIITEEQSEFIDNVIPLEYIKENYNPYTADKLKWGGAPLDNKFLNDHKKEFLKVWLEILVPNFRIYVSAYLRNTYGFWSLSNMGSSSPYTSIYVESWSDWYTEENVSIKTVFSPEVESGLENFLTPLTKDILGQGTIFWIFVLFLMVMWLRHGFWSMLFGIPVLSNWLTIMISTPVAYQWRYVYCTVLMLPLMIGILCISQKSYVEVTGRKRKN